MKKATKIKNMLDHQVLVKILQSDIIGIKKRFSVLPDIDDGCKRQQMCNLKLK